MNPCKEYQFACRACDSVIAVNDSMRDALLEHGCVVCGEPVTHDTFDDV